MKAIKTDTGKQSFRCHPLDNLNFRDMASPCLLQNQYISHEYSEEIPAKNKKRKNQNLTVIRNAG